ncbi:MAG: peptidase T [Bacilli bacterium]|nr:peptidase T [Bacilli bacterium]
MDQDLQRFIDYVKIDTQSDDTSETTPSTMKQYDLAKLLKSQLEGFGLKSEIDEYGRVYSFLPGEKDLPTIGLNSHMDTALEISGKDVKPQLIQNYDGGVIKLNDTYSMSPEDFPNLKKYVGTDLIVTSGDTLLGADDKAGDAIIMEVIKYYVENPEEKHHPIAILFTPDEEIGRGPEHFDAKKFGAEWAYTIDGSEPELIDIETFNAAHADIHIQGIAIHPGEAKNKLINALSLATLFDSTLPKFARPEFTTGYEGFYHLISLNGTSEHADMHYIIRNHDSKKLDEQIEKMKEIRNFVANLYPKAKIELSIEKDYRNMKEILDKDPRAVNHAIKVYKSLGINPEFRPVRGGTDGATFSFLGCPTPNLGTGSYNHHGRYEYLSVKEFREMIKIVKALVKA